MGYDTTYELSFMPDLPQIRVFQCQHGKPDNARFCPTCGEVPISAEEAIFEEIKELTACNVFEGEWKWYRWEEDMREVSKKYPEIVIKLKGKGADSDDIWFAYFKAGKVQLCRAKITYDEYDESKLE